MAGLVGIYASCIFRRAEKPSSVPGEDHAAHVFSTKLIGHINFKVMSKLPFLELFEHLTRFLGTTDKPHLSHGALEPLQHGLLRYK